MIIANVVKVAIAEFESYSARPNLTERKSTKKKEHYYYYFHA